MTHSLIATFTALPGRREEVARLIADFADVVRREEGCLVFQPFSDADSDHDFLVYEQYLDEDAFRAHMGNPAGPAFNAALVREIVGDGSQLQFLNEVPEPVARG